MLKRSLLFIPASNAANVLHSGTLGADIIILDLEDSVSIYEKDAARILARNAIMAMDFPCGVAVRINARSTPFWKDDIDCILPAQPDFFNITKVDSKEYIDEVDAYITMKEKELGLEVGKVKLICLVETALGLENAYQIASASPRVSALFLGAGDLALDMSFTRTVTGEEIAYARSKILSAAHAANIDAFDTPFMYLNDTEGCINDAELAKQLGFTGKASIYPAHVDIFNEAFSPTQKEIDRAYEIMDALEEAERQGKGVVQVNGEMIDGPIVVRAQKTLAMLEEMKGGAAL